MSDDNKHNLQYFESLSMRELFDLMEGWQNEHKKRLLSTNIQKDGDKFCCIALTNPSEVTIVGWSQASESFQSVGVYKGRLCTFNI